jgi:hypothetical protein
MRDLSIQTGRFSRLVTGDLKKNRAGKNQGKRKLAGCVEVGDLIRVHFFADLQQQMGVCFFQFSPGLGNAIDLRKESTFLERLGAAEDFHLRFFLLQCLVPANQCGPVFVKQVIHSFLLPGSQMECFCKVLVVPPAARGAELQSTAHRAAGGACLRTLLRRRVGRETLARIGRSYASGRASRDI